MTRLARRPRCPPLPSCRGFVLYAFGLHFAGVHRSLALHVDDIGGVHRHGVTLGPAHATRKWQNGGGISIAMIGAFSGVDEKSEATLLLVIEPPSGSCNAVSNFGRIVFTRFARRSAFGGKVNDGPYWCSVLFLKFLKSLFSILAPHFFTLASRHKRGGLRPPRDNDFLEKGRGAAGSLFSWGRPPNPHLGLADGISCAQAGDCVRCARAQKQMRVTA